MVVASAYNVTVIQADQDVDHGSVPQALKCSWQTASLPKMIHACPGFEVRHVSARMDDPFRREDGMRNVALCTD